MFNGTFGARSISRKLRGSFDEGCAGCFCYFGYFTVIAAPASTIIYSSGLIQAKDFLKVGWKVGIFSMITSILYANTYWLLF